jgi:hypothetical protein
MKEKAIHVIWRSIKALKDIIVECGEVPGTQRGDEYVNTFRSSTIVYFILNRGHEIRWIQRSWSS